MFGEIMKGLFNAEEKTSETITNTLEDLAEELNTDFKNFFIMIVPINETFKHKFYVYKKDEKGVPVFVREISLAEILE